MPADINPDVARRVSDAARHLNSVKARMERAATWEERRLLQIELEAAEAEMQDAAMNINRGLDRVQAAAR